MLNFTVIGTRDGREVSLDRETLEAAEKTYDTLEALGYEPRIHVVWTALAAHALSALEAM